MASSLESKQILIVANQPIIAEAMRSLLLEIDHTIEITFCNSAIAALNECTKKYWHGVLLDIDMPDAHGLTLARQFKKFGIANKCAVVSSSENQQWCTEAMSMGMLGYIIKTLDINDFRNALMAFLKGQMTFPKKLVPLKKSHQKDLTRRQEEVLRLICGGLPTPEIALQLGLTTWTVEHHVDGILVNLNAKNRAQAVAKAIGLGKINFQSIPL
jgi:DNA-binding NarL/FixJ family response regulator